MLYVYLRRPHGILVFKNESLNLLVNKTLLLYITFIFCVFTVEKNTLWYCYELNCVIPPPHPQNLYVEALTPTPSPPYPRM